jgi:hypothetical protein
VLDTRRVLEGTTEDLKQLSPLIKALGTEGDLVAAPGGRRGGRHHRFTIAEL